MQRESHFLFVFSISPARDPDFLIKDAVNNSTNKVLQSSAVSIAIVVVAGFAILFFTSVSSLSFQLKAVTAVVVLVALLLFIFLSPVFKGSSTQSDRSEGPASEAGRLDEELEVLEEAATFFSASIKQDEMLRLLEARLGNVLTECTSRIFRLTEDGTLDAPHSGRAHSTTEIPERVALVTDTAAQALTTSEIVRSEDVFRSAALRKSRSRVAAVSLRRAGDVFCVLAFACEAEGELPPDETIQAIAERLTPLISGSISFETSVSNALRDSLTGLPNERAMFLLLENQVAEAQRFGSTRPVSVLAIDIRSFDEINRRFGHSTGDRILVFAAATIKEQLRKMDMLARTSDDEFIVVLPTADMHSSANVIERIDQSFAENKFELPDGTKHTVRLSYGKASFGDDGDTASLIVGTAIERKRVHKSAEKGSVIEFPKDKPSSSG